MQKKNVQREIMLIFTWLRKWTGVNCYSSSQAILDGLCSGCFVGLPFCLARMEVASITLHYAADHVCLLAWNSAQNLSEMWLKLYLFTEIKHLTNHLKGISTVFNSVQTGAPHCRNH